MSNLNEKLVMAKMLGKIALTETPLFLLRRASQKFGSKSRLNQDIIVVDWDETLCKVNTAHELLKMFAGEKKGNELYNHFRNLVKKGKSLEEAMLEGSKYLVEKGITVNHYRKLLAELEKNNLIRTDLVEVIKFLRSKGRKVLLATKSGQVIADLVKEKFGFDGAIGTKEYIDKLSNKILGTRELIGNKKGFVDGVRVVSKLDRIAEWCISSGIQFNKNRIAVLSDGYDDLAIFKKAGFSVLLYPNQAGSLQKVSKKFKLYDFIVPENKSFEIAKTELLEKYKMIAKLKLVLKKPLFARKPKRIELASARLAQIRFNKRHK